MTTKAKVFISSSIGGLEELLNTFLEDDTHSIISTHFTSTSSFDKYGGNMRERHNVLVLYIIKP